MSALEQLDSLTAGPVLVFGTPPPVGRDFDLLAREDEFGRLSAGLPDLGFRRDGARFLRFGDCSVDVVELVPAADWALPEAELEALFGDSLELEGAQNLRRPAPHHDLLILARKAAWSGLPADAKQRARIDAAVADDAGAFEQARSRAPAWGARAALDMLERAWRSGATPGSRERAAAIAELRRARGESPGPEALVALRSLARRPRRGRLITLSGLDGAGKSSQAEALSETLDRLGHDAVVRWTSLSQHPPILHFLTNAANRVLGRGRASAAETAKDDDDPGAPGKALRERSALLTFGWSTIVALTNALSQAKATRRELWRGRVVICDRYTLDSMIHLRYAYGEDRAFRFQRGLIRLLSPRPDRAFLLDVSPEEATRRKADYPLAENARRARLYRDEHSRLGVERVDGEQPKEQICALLAEKTLRMLER